MKKLDKIDHSIIAALVADARLSMAKLSDRVGLSKTPVQARLNRLEQEGYIKGYSARIDRQKLELGHIAFVQVSLSDTRAPALKAFNDAVLKISEIEQCHMIASNFDYLLKVRTRDINSYRRVLGEQISTLPHVAQTSTHVAMEAVKEN